jgi:FkbM family methyltransferase
VTVPSSLRPLLRPIRELLLLAATRGHGVSRTVNGLSLRVDSRTRFNFVPNYDAPAAAFLRASVTNGSEIWNVGANVGVYALQLASWVGAEGKVVAFEPNPTAARLLATNLRLNQLERRVEVVEAAVGESKGEVEFYTYRADGMARAARPNPLLKRVAKIRVPVTTLDAFAADCGRVPAWVIMDIEGWEIAALRSARLLAGVSQFVVELHPSAWEWSGDKRGDLEALLTEFQLEPVSLVGQVDPLAEHGQVFLRRIGEQVGR